MLLYNITNKVEHAIHAEWLGWMQSVYIPELMSSDVFEEYRLCRMKGVDETDGITYALQLTVSSKPAFDIYQEKYAYEHQQLHDKRYKGQFVTFRSVLDIVASGE